ncbi:Sodium/glutamate symport carrier protein [Roseovarius albus]|uniref:Sodium/glutamate symporter n=1 Tax=Roseovarius albus TaxID=1247867 RepID=A0A1X6YKH7_9RHOB|nr:sodium/glutamate symporter [Roseovarius albus]SLN23697.1 Sodium/glutamate symport carrier protein [Roseovarius albus]
MADAITISNFATFTLGMLVYFAGAALTRRWAILREFNIPEPVVGGITVSLLIWAFYILTGTEVSFDLTVRDGLLIIFFTTIGLNARLSELKRGGKALGILLVLTVVYIVIQNAVGRLGVGFFGLPEQLSIMLGSAALIGGHGTAIAWGPELYEQFGIAEGAEVGLAAATVGLILAALIGGPIARFLIKRHDLKPENEDADPIVGLDYNEAGSAPLNYVGFMVTLITINLTVIAGMALNEGIAETGLKLPDFVPCMILGIAVANLKPILLPKVPAVAGTPVLALISEFSLAVFLSMSLMSMQLWTLAELAGPLFVVLGVQAVVAVLFCIFVLFPAMGRNYRAAVLGAGFGGFALGATPTAIANMTSVTKRYGPSPVAFLILPLVSAFFVDLANAAIIQIFLSF